MKAPKEYKRWISMMKKYYGKPNGVINGWFLDAPRMEYIVKRIM